MKHIPLKLKSVALLVILSLITLLGTKYILPYFYSFIFAYWLAKCSVPIVYYLSQRFHLHKTVANLLTMALILFVIGSILYLVISSFVIQVNQLFHNIPLYKQIVYSKLNEICHCCDRCFQLKKGVTFSYFNETLISFATKKDSLLFPTVTKQTLALMAGTLQFFTQSGIIIFSSLLIVQDYDKLHEMYQKWFLHDDVDQVLHELSRTGLRYMKIQALITVIIAIICIAGLFFAKSPYPLLLGTLISLLDALPLFGSGTILVPWAIICLFSHNIIGAAILMSTYLLCQITRQYLESTLLGNTLGLAPIYFVMSLFIGIGFYGLSGFFLGPFSILLIKTLYFIYQPRLTQS